MSDKALQDFLDLKRQLALDEQAYQQALGSYQHAQQLAEEKFGTSDINTLVRKAKAMDKALDKQKGVFTRNMVRFKRRYRRHLEGEV